LGFMGAEALRIFEQALTLSETERAELAAKLLASLDEASDPDAEEAWAAEITKRAESVARGEAKLVAWEDVDAEAALIVTR
jgi:putative addiction module component (TIGR02574 family)